jgi:para-nitrobenzyl esterase
MGGSTSTSMYDGTGFAEKGVVLVSVAYRVGPFGFFAHPELSRESGKGSGNYGLEDMIAGMKWVKENIARFGGDSYNVTIFGHSAGGMAVSMLAASPVTKDLFRRAISMSGASFAPLQTSSQTSTGMNLGIPTLKLAESNGEEFLKKLGAADIKAARALGAEDIQKNMGFGMGIGSFRPVADGYVVPTDLFSMYEDLKLSDMISSYWVNFAKTGDPNGPSLPEWPAFEEKDQKVMVFDSGPGARTEPNLEKLKAFDAYFAWLREQVKKEVRQ